MDKVFESVNKIIPCFKMYPELFDYTNIDHLLELYDKGPFLIMKNRDTEGRQILIVRYKILEDFKFEFADICKLNNLTITAMINEPETQISGIVIIHDFRDISMNYLSIIDLSLLAKILPCANVSAIRIKQFNILGLPAFAIVGSPRMLICFSLNTP